MNEYYNLYIKYNITNYYEKYYDDATDISSTIRKMVNSFLNGMNVYNVFLLSEFLLKSVLNDIVYKVKIPGFLYSWFTYEPIICINNSKLTCEVLAIPIHGDIVYYKFPSKHKIFELLAQEELL